MIRDAKSMKGVRRVLVMEVHLRKITLSQDAMELLVLS